MPDLETKPAAARRRPRKTGLAGCYNNAVKKDSAGPQPAAPHEIDDISVLRAAGEAPVLPHVQDESRSNAAHLGWNTAAAPALTPGAMYYAK